MMVERPCKGCGKRSSGHYELDRNKWLCGLCFSAELGKLLRRIGREAAEGVS